MPTTPEDVVLPPARALAEAQRLLDTGRPFHAHEVLEGAWKAAPDHERELWRGLAQLAVGLTHAHRGNAVGARRLLLRAAERIELYAEQTTWAPVGTKQVRRIMRFTHNWRTPPDNNVSERDIRMIKVRQKVSGCQRTLTGAKQFCAIRSSLSTAAKHGIHLFDALVALTNGQPWMPATA